MAPLRVPTTVRTAKVAAAALKAMEVDVVALDSRVPDEDDAPTRVLRDAALPLVEPFEGSMEDSGQPGSQVVNRGSRRIGFLSQLPSGPGDTQWTRGMERVRREAPLMMAVDWGPCERAQALAEQGDLDGVSVVLLAGPADGGNSQPARARNALLVLASPSSSGVTVATLGFAAQEVEAIEQRVHGADPEDKPDGAVQDAVAEALSVVQSHEQQGTPVQQAVGADVGYGLAHECGECHEHIYDGWKAGPHAGALATLREEGKGNDEGCLACHSEYFRRTGEVPGSAMEVEGVECASCHGDVLLHGLTGRGNSVPTGVKPRGCVACHTPNRSPDFEYDAYRAVLSH